MGSRLLLNVKPHVNHTNNIIYTATMLHSKQYVPSTKTKTTTKSAEIWEVVELYTIVL